MATTQKGIYYPDDYTAIADIPEDMKDLAESVDTALGDLEDNVEQDMQPQIDDIVSEQTTQNNEIEALQIENERLKATLPTTTGEGTEVTLQNTAELEFIQPPLPRGNSEQVQYSGKNKLNLDNINSVGTGRKVTKIDDNNYKYEVITANEWWNNTNYSIEVEPNTSYVWSLNVSAISIGSGHNLRILYDFYDANNNQIAVSNNYVDISTTGNYTKTFTTTSATVKILLRIYVETTSPTVGSYVILNNFMLEQGSTATAYEPYVGGTASPNPSYPQAISNVTGDVEVLVQNKNLWNEQWELGRFDNVSSSPTFGEKVNTTDQIRVKDFIRIKPNTSYYGVYGGSSGAMFVIAYDENYKGIASYGLINLTNRAMTTPSNAKYIKFYCSSEYGTTYANNIAIVEGSTASTYTPHKKQTLPLTLGNIELCKIGTAQDYFYKENNKWYLYKAINKVELTAENVDSLVGGLNTTTYSKPYITITKSLLGWKSSWTQNISLINNYSVITSTSKIESGTYAVNFLQSYLTIFDDRFTDLATARQLLIGTIIYITLATPTSTEITDTTLIEQLDAISNAISYDEQTNISGTSDEANPLFSVEAYQSIKLILAS